MERVDKDNYYLNIAESVLNRATCLRRIYGAVIVNNDEIISTGYNGAPRGVKNCTDTGTCIRIQLGIPRGKDYTICKSVHAEQNAIISASRRDMIGATLYLCGIDVDSGEYVKNADCCPICKRMIINAGITKVITRNSKTDYRITYVAHWINNDELLVGNNGY